MNDIVSPLQSISYTNKDFVSVYEELLDLTKQLTSLWDPSISNESDPGVILLKLNAVIADKCNYSIDKSILECFPLSVTQEANARQLFEQLGYYMHWYKAATTDVYIKWIGSPIPNQTITIPKFTMVTDDNSSVIYTLLGPSESSITGAYNISDQTISCDGNDDAVFTAIQGLAVDYDINGNTLITVANLDSNNRLYFPTTDVAENGIFIRNVSEENYTSWYKVDNLVAENSGNNVYKFGVARDGSSCYIEFPDDVNQLFNEGIYITYIRTNGNQGNISSQYISRFYNFNTSIQGDTTINIDSTNVLVTNYSSAVNGYDTEGINSAYRSYQRTVGTFKTLVTLRDYINYINNSGLVSNGFVCDRSNDIQQTYRILASVNDIDQTINITDDNITAFSLKLYLLNYVEDVNIGNYVSTFRMLTNDEQSTIKNYVYDTQTINHEFSEILDPTPTSSNICFFKNKCPIECTIIAQSVLTATQTNEMKTNIINALYQQFNSKEINFGDKFPYDLVYKTILESDSRIKNISLGNIDYTTYAVYQDSTRTLTYSATSAAWYDNEWNVDKPSNYGIIVSNPTDGAVVHLPTVYKEVNLNNDSDIVYFCSNNKNLVLNFDSETYINHVGIIDVYNTRWFKYESSKWNVYQYDYETKDWELIATDITLSDYGISFSGQSGATDEFKIRLSYAHQFRNDVYVKSVLAGITQFFVKDETFDYRLNFNYRNQVDNVEKLWSNVDITFESDDLDFPESEYILKPNESLQFYAPNLFEKNTYTGNVKFEYQLNNVVTKGSNYQLSSNEYIIFYWKESSNYNYKYHSYGEGTIICPSIELDPNEIPGNNVADIQEYHLLNYVEVSSGTYAYGEKSSDIYGDISARANSAIDTIASANNRLTSSNNIKIKQLSQFDISSASNYGVYWVLNYEDNGKYVLFTEGQTSRILNIDEMFIFTNPSFTSYTVLGAGTEISRNTIGDIWQVDAVDASTILNDGLEALKDVFFKIPTAATITATENIFTTFSNETLVRIAPNSDSVYTYQVDPTSNITITSFDADFWNTSNVGKINNVEIRYQNDIDHPWKIYVDDSTSYDVSNEELLSAYGVQLDSTSATTSDKVTVLYYLDYNLQFNREGCQIILPEGSDIYRPGSGQISLAQFSIRYKTKDSNEFNSLDDMILTNQSGWRARSLLAINISSTVYQILLGNQSILYKLLNDDTEYSIEGKNATAEDYQNDIPASYPVCLMSSFGISSDGGDIIDTHFSSYDSDGTVVKTYLSLYEFKKLQDLPEAISLTNDRKFIFSDNGDVNFTFTPAVNDRSIHIALPIGEYIVAVKNNQDNLENVYLSLDGTALNQMYNYTDSSTSDISAENVYYMYLPMESVYLSQKNISTTMTTQTVTTTSAYDTNYGNGTYIFTVAYNDDETKYILIDSYGNKLVPENGTGSATKNDYQSFGLQLSRAISANNNDIGKKIIISNEHTLGLHIEGQEYDCMIQISNCYKYVFPETFSSEQVSFTEKWISALDQNHIYKYSHEVPESTLIMNPLDPNEFFNSNHIYNKFTIGQLDKIRIK